MTPESFERNDFDAIAVTGLTKFFDGVAVVDGIDLTVRQGEIVGFLGPNGSGKTTSIRMMCGLLTPDGGSGSCLGYDIVTQSDKIKRHVGYMTQRFSFWEDLTVAENLDFVARVYKIADRKQAVKTALTDLGLTARSRQLTGTLSGGWKQRLALAACLLHRPRLLLLDEPTAGVDPGARRDFWEELHRLAATGISILVSTHYMDEAERCHRLAYIARGKLLASGTAAEITEAAGLSTLAISGDALSSLAGKLASEPAVTQTAIFGNRLHVSGSDSDALTKTLTRITREHGQYAIEAVETSLEDVFIYRMSRHAQSAASPPGVSDG